MKFSKQEGLDPINEQAKFNFNRSFAPHQGLITELERPYREEISLNGSWRFQGVPLPADWEENKGQPPELTPPDPERWEETYLKVPSPWNVNSFARGDGGDFRVFPSYPAAWEEFKMGWLKKTFISPEDLPEKRVILHFEAVAGYAEVYINGKKVKENFDAFLPFEIDITAQLDTGGQNEILVGIRKASLFDDRSTVGYRSYQGGSFWGTHIVGIWQDVSLLILPAVYIEQIYLKPLVSTGVLAVELTVNNQTNQRQEIAVSGELRPWSSDAAGDVLSAPEVKWHLEQPVLKLTKTAISLPPGEQTEIILTKKINNELELWEPASPSLYGLVLTIAQKEGVIDRFYQRFGWREYKLAGDRYYLNGKPIKFKGDSWHFMGIPQMTRRYAWAWYKMLKAANANTVRLHAQPFPRFYLELADEMGICILDETAIWASDGGPKVDSEQFWASCKEHVERLVLRDRNHPSIFGWSVCNEVVPVIKRLYKRPDLLDPLYRAIEDWLEIVRALDTTRPWISGDGEKDAEGRFPVIIDHYGGEDTMRDLAARGKPWGIGEHSGCYYATPRQVTRYNGERAYQSQQGRMEALAIESYQLLQLQQELKATFASIFNLVWYGLKPLELGLADITCPPELTDGVFFPEFSEGRPGVQPERLGPYCTTLNPGYDSRLPLYQPWPVFEAVKDAFGCDGAIAGKWESESPESKEVVRPLPVKIRDVVLLGAEASKARIILEFLGLPIKAKFEQVDQCIIIDGVHPPTGDRSEIKRQINQVLKNGGTVFCWGVAEESLAAINQLLPLPLALTERKASSLLPLSTDPVIAGLTAADFYLSEKQESPVMVKGLAGEFVEQGSVILEACNSDWGRWNGQPEYTKTAALLRSEREAKGAGAALVGLAQGRGRVLVSSLNQDIKSIEVREVYRKLFSNLGIELQEAKAMIAGNLFDQWGVLQQALVSGRFGAESFAAAAAIDFLGGETAITPVNGEQVGEYSWQCGSSNEQGVFDFLQMGLPGVNTNGAVYLSFWLYSPRPLDDLLIEPNMPKLDLLIGSDDGFKLWLNGRLLQSDHNIHSCQPGQFKIEALPLQRSWNHLLIKVTQDTGAWQFSGQLQCDRYEFLLSLKSALEKPGHKQ